MKRTAIYMRVSSDRQAKDGQSLEFQQSLLMGYIRDHSDLVLVDSYMDDGVSGTKFAQRDELQRMLNDVKDGKIDLIIFTKLDRFFRSVRHLMNTLDTLDQYGVEWKAIQENHDNTTPTGKLALTIMGAFAEMEADMGSVRVRDAFANKISKGEWLNSHPPFGYVIKDKKAVPDPVTSQEVREIFKDYIRHNSISKLVKDHRHPKSTKSMRRILTNRVYLGEAHGIKDFVEPIIDRETFDTVQRLLAINVKTSVKHTYLFSGLMICPECGHKLTSSTYNRKYPRYTCRYHTTGRCTYNHVVYESVVERDLIGRYREDLEKRYLSLKSVKRVDNSQKISALYHKIDRLKDLYVNDLIDLDTYKADLARYKADIEAFERPATVNTEHIENLLKLNVYVIYWTLDRDQKRRLWRSVVKSITPNDGAFDVEYL